MTQVSTTTTVWHMNATTAWSTLSAHPLLLAAIISALGVLALIVYLRRRHARRWLVVASFAMSLAINAEGMWVVATQRLNLPAAFAVGVFSVFEIFLITEMTLAADQYRRTTRRNPDGSIAKAGHPGKHGRAVWLIGFMSGTIVAFNSHSLVEVLLRYTLPLMATLLWWNNLTAEGTGRSPSRLAWTPRRLAERLGLLVPDVDDDLDALARERRIRALVNVQLRLDGKIRPVWFHGWRQSRLARLADEAMVDEAADRIARVRDITALLRGGRLDVGVVTTSGDVAEVPTGDVAEDFTGDLTADLSEDVTSHLTGHVSEDLTEDVTTDVTDAPPRTSPDTSSKTSPKPNATALKIARLRVRYPDGTQREIAKRAAASLSTVQRYWPDTAPDVPRTNGHAVPELVPGGSS